MKAPETLFAENGYAKFLGPYSGSHVSLTKTPLLPGFVNGTSNRNYQTLIARHQDASSAYTIYGLNSHTSARIMADCTLQIQDRSRNISDFAAHSVEYFPTNVYLPSGVLPTDSDLDNLALTRMKNKLNSVTKQVNAMVPLIELRELHSTIRGLANIALNFLNVANSIRHGRLPNGARLSKNSSTVAASKRAALSDAWLTYSFGVRPLISDVDNITQSIATYLYNRQGGNVTLAGSATKRWYGKVGGYTTSNSEIAYGTVSLMAEQALVYHYVAGMQLYPAGSEHYGAIEHFGLGASSTASVLWELMAYSWVIDYFTNVGRLLEDRFSSPPGTTVYCDKSISYKIKGYIDVTSVKPTSLPGYNINGWQYSAHHGEWEGFSFNRVPLGGMPHIGFSVKSLDQIGKNAVSKVLNLASILHKDIKPSYRGLSRRVI